MCRSYYNVKYLLKLNKKKETTNKIMNELTTIYGNVPKPKLTNDMKPEDFDNYYLSKTRDV